MRFHYYDANCLIKLVIDEAGSVELREFFYGLSSTAITTSFCFYEALSVLKAKWLKTTRVDSIPLERYLASSEELCALVEDGLIQIEELSFYDMDSFKQSEKLTKEYGVDLSDSFQLITIKNGMMAKLNTSVVPELITEDKNLCEAAKNLGLPCIKIEDLNVNEGE